MTDGKTDQNSDRDDGLFGETLSDEGCSDAGVGDEVSCGQDCAAPALEAAGISASVGVRSLRIG
jgi:hypothetical protein